MHTTISIQTHKHSYIREAGLEGGRNEKEKKRNKGGEEVTGKKAQIYTQRETEIKRERGKPKPEKDRQKERVRERKKKRKRGKTEKGEIERETKKNSIG